WLQRLLAGEIPFWTSHLSGGMPFLAEPTHQVFYPLNFIFMLPLLTQSLWTQTSLSPGSLSPLVLQQITVQGISWFCIAHSLLGMVFFYFFIFQFHHRKLPALFGALLYGLSGYNLSISENIGYLPAVTWSPLAAYFFWQGLKPLNTEKISFLQRFKSPETLSGVAGIGLCLAAMMLAGDFFNPEVLIGIFGIYLLIHCSHPKGKFGSIFLISGILLSLLLSAIQLLPTWELMKLSVRQTPLTFEEATLWSFPPQRMIEWIVPFFYGSKYPSPHFIGMFLYPQFREPWVDSIYLGIIPLLFSAYALFHPKSLLPQRDKLFWSGIILLSFALALGSFGFYTKTLYQILPFLQFHRYPEKYIFWSNFTFCTLAALGSASMDKHFSGLSQQPKTSTLKKFSPSPQQNTKVYAYLSNAFRCLFSLKGFIFLISIAILELIFIEIPSILWIWPHQYERSADWGSFFLNREAHIMSLRIPFTLVITLCLSYLFWSSGPWKRGLFYCGMGMAFIQLVMVHYQHLPTAPTGLLNRTEEPEALRIIAQSKTQKTNPPLGNYEAPIQNKNTVQDPEGNIRIFYDDWTEKMATPLAQNLFQKIATAYHQPFPTEKNLDAFCYQHFWIYKFLLNQDRLLFYYGSLYGVDYLNGRFSPLQLQDHQRLDMVLQKFKPNLWMPLNGVSFILTTLNPKNPQWHTPQLNPIEPPSFEEVGHSQPLNLQILKVTKTLEKAYLAPHVIYNLESDVYPMLTASFQGPNSTVEIEKAALPKETMAKDTLSFHPNINIQHPSEESYQIQLDSPYLKSFLVILDGYYPGWQALLDGKPVPVYKANHRYLSVEVPRGKHHVKLSYQSTYFYGGFFLSLLGLCIFMLLIFQASYFSGILSWAAISTPRKVSD
ncbi:MAG: YfhO family protein, partial [Cyanobacteria bacterium]|nr:YfhO family protein [Cyanobacteriota bacterium]